MEYVVILVVIGLTVLTFLIGAACIDVQERITKRKKRAAERTKVKAEVQEKCRIACTSYDRNKQIVWDTRPTIKESA